MERLAYLLGILSVSLTGFSAMAQADLYYVVASEGNAVYEVGPEYPFTESSWLNEENGVLIGGFNALASDPTTGQNYVVYWEQEVGPGVRWLGTADFASMTVQTTGLLFDKIAALACNSEGQLYGITGDGGQNPNVLYLIDPDMPGVPNQVANFSATPDDDGEALAFHPLTGPNVLYRLAGGNYFYQIDLQNMSQELMNPLYDGGTCGHAIHSHGDGFVTMATYFCLMSMQGDQYDCSPEFMPCVKGMVPATVAVVDNIPSSGAVLVSVRDLAGRVVPRRCNVPQLLIYSDGTVRKEFCFE